MRFVWISALKDLRRLRREPVTMLTWLAIPDFRSGDPDAGLRAARSGAARQAVDRR